MPQLHITRAPATATLQGTRPRSLEPQDALKLVSLVLHCVIALYDHLIHGPNVCRCLLMHAGHTIVLAAPLSWDRPIS